MRKSDFLGRWQLRRTITDHKGAQSGTLSGHAAFTLLSDGRLQYDESGQLTLQSGPRFTAQRRYLWQMDGTAVQVYFDDGRPFHHFVAGQTGQGTTHLCGDDTYDVTYDFDRWPQWSARWRVQGPRKDYVSDTSYHQG